MGRKRKKEIPDFKLTNLGYKDEVTGTSVLLEIDGLRILFDLGSYQSQTEKIDSIYKKNAKKLGIDFSQIDYIIISHSHLDHCGMLGVLAKEELGFNGKVMCTEASSGLIALNIVDSAFIMQQETKAYNKRAKKQLYPLYTMEDAEKVIPMIQGYGYNTDIYLNDKVYFRFIPNGHMFGSASIYLTYIKDEYTNKHILFTGDHFYNANELQRRPFTNDFDKNKILKPSIVITEATYGNKLHNLSYDVEKDLEQYILESYRKNHVLFIPAFAIARSTQIAYYIKRIFKKHPEIMKDENYKVYMSGKLMKNAHNIIGSERYKKEFVDEKWYDGYDLFQWDKIVKLDKFQDVEDKLLDNKPKIIIASSGMISGGYSTFLAEHLIPRGNVDILLCGYQADGTIGRKLLDFKDGKRGNRLTVQGKEVRIKCNVLGALTLSGHADKKQLSDLVAKQCDNKVLKSVLIIHGSEDAKESLKESIESKTKNIDVNVMEINKPYKL